jgi:hypothetical protein
MIQELGGGGTQALHIKMKRFSKFQNFSQFQRFFTKKMGHVSLAPPHPWIAGVLNLTLGKAKKGKKNFKIKKNFN